MKSIIITDLNGGTLKLTANYLKELTGGGDCYLRLKELAKAYKKRYTGNFEITIYRIGRPSSNVSVRVLVPGEETPLRLFSGITFDQGKIGCRPLSAENFNTILKVAKATLRSKKTQTVAKARAAAAGRAKRK